MNEKKNELIVEILIIFMSARKYFNYIKFLKRERYKLFKKISHLDKLKNNNQNSNHLSRLNKKNYCKKNIKKYATTHKSNKNTF